MVACVYKLAAKNTLVVNCADGRGCKMFKQGCRRPYPNPVGDNDEDATGIAQKVASISASAHIESRVGAIPWT
jgi:hypothetical protein